MPKRRSKRYAAKLLFQFRTVVNGQSARRRICEERIVVFPAGSAKAALTTARRKGRHARFKSVNDEGHPVHFEFVGVLDLLCLDPACEPDEVWFDLRPMVQPMKRRRKLIPSDAALLAQA